MLSLLKNLLTREKLDYTTLLEKGALIIDVRSPEEFSRGHADQSVNIPLGEINNHLIELKQQKRPVITCCRSGARSAVAANNLKKAGIETYNGGSWKDVQSALTV